MKGTSKKNNKSSNTKLVVKSSLREDALEWFFAKSEIEKMDLKNKHFNTTTIQHSSQWGYHFTFGQIEEMFVKEQLTDKIKINKALLKRMPK